MNDYNFSSVYGQVEIPPELIPTKSGVPMIRVIIGVRRVVKNNTIIEPIEGLAFGNLAEQLLGAEIKPEEGFLSTGSLSGGQYTTKTNDVRYTLTLFLNKVTLTDRPGKTTIKEAEQTDTTPETVEPKQEVVVAPEQVDDKTTDEEKINIDDVPF